MAKKKEQIVYPSTYGSHKSMVVKDDENKNFWDINQTAQGLIKLRDDEGYYWTEPSRLDNGLADPNRYNNRGYKSQDQPA